MLIFCRRQLLGSASVTLETCINSLSLGLSFFDFCVVVEALILHITFPFIAACYYFTARINIRLHTLCGTHNGLKCSGKECAVDSLAEMLMTRCLCEM